MADVSNELLYEVLKKMQAELVDMRDDISELKTRVTAIDEHMGGLIIQVSGNNNRLDRMDERLKRVERRLELTDLK